MEEIATVCPACGYKWKYKGNRLSRIAEGKRVFVTCPACHANVKITKETINNVN